MAKLLFSLAGITLLHSAFSTYEHLSELKALERPQDRPLPHDIVIETLAALLLGIFGAVINTPPLKEITWSSEMKHRTADEMDARLSFATVNHKGRNFFGSQV
ncbi:magnesium transporter [Hysterangium stoloniferum]|nr:magnesium transporter [Hysterangium stoloniferum]